MYQQSILPAEKSNDPQALQAPGAAIHYRQQLEGQCYLEENTILYVCRGRWRIEHGTTILHAGAGQVVFLYRHILVRYRATADTAAEAPSFLLLHLGGSIVRDFARKAHLQPVQAPAPTSIFLHQPGPRLLSCLQSAEVYFRNGAAMTEGLIRLKLQELLHCLPGSRADQPLLEQVLDLRQSYRCDITSIVEENITNTLSLGQLATLSGRSLSSFRRDFLAIYNMPPSKWIRLRRLDKSLELLASTRMTVTDICYTLGFENIAHFSRLFKSRFGLSPSACRNMGTPQSAATPIARA